ncbi:hypothetical protein LTR37_010122 [Vermiconidia calcicola]|uniref:Uncharacterized protein n=1 Tax=Vermiconidia calcicola TaxID=1690605 RepID=A0ACC3N5Z9_9PEZI|nr:hypothetical protein LTR37_010122 [Vermiconidia calcicola]
MADINSTPSLTCATCSKAGATNGSPLQKCGGCRTTFYCSKDCQKADWKSHRTSCKKQNSTNSGTKQNGNGNFQSSKATMEAMLGLNTTTWLYNRPEAEVYTLLIDSYRMRVEDEYNFRGDVDDDSIYGGGDPTKGFRRFLLEAEKRSGVLPSWWNAEKRNACVAKGDSKDHWSTLHCAVEKSDVQEHYKKPSMPMQLRMLAEEIIGSNVMAF